MSDYLNSLVSRTLRLGQVVQPRLASFFEPVAAGPASEPATEVSETRAPRETLPAAVPVTTPFAPLQNTETNIETQPLNESASAVTESRPIQTPLVPAPTMPPPVLSLNHNAEDTREVVRDDNSDSTVVSETHSNPTPPRLKPEVRIVSSLKDREQEQPSTTTPPSILTYAAAPPAPLLPGRRVSAQAAAEIVEAPESVVVTIGRVDVRAVFPSQPAPAPRSNRVQQQAMSLDEYLKQRSEGRR